MTAPAAPAVPKPTTIQYAVGALIVAGVAGVIASLFHATSGFKDYYFRTVKASDLKSSDVKSGKTKMPTDASIRHDINSSVLPSIILSIVLLVVLGYIAYSVWNGRYWTRWATLGIFALLSVFLTGSEGGLGGVLLITSGAPAAYKIFALITSLAMISAVIATNVRPSLAFLALNRPVRAPRPAGGLFAPRPSAGSTKARTAPGKPTGRTPGKPAGGTTAKPANKSVSKPITPTPVSPAKSRSRGKSRRAPVDDKTV